MAWLGRPSLGRVRQGRAPGVVEGHDADGQGEERGREARVGMLVPRVPAEGGMLHDLDGAPARADQRQGGDRQAGHGGGAFERRGAGRHGGMEAADACPLEDPALRGIGSTCHRTPDPRTVVRAMSTETEIREFLTTRRAKLTPEQAGLPTFGRQRRVAGLRREEVALLAGISVEYYTRLERGNARGVSEGVLDSICDALQLNDAERDHLTHLARSANAERPPRRVATPPKVRPSIARIVDAMTGVAATVRNSRLDLLYANDLGRALFSDMFKDPRGANS